MSTVGQAAGGLVGGIAGFFLSGGSPTGALYGAQTGLSIGGYLDPVKGPVSEGPRLSDLSVQTSTYGAVIPRIYGTVSVTGNVFWLENNALRETVTKKKSGGKGGGSKTTTRIYSYSATFAVGLDDTHAKGSPLVGVRRIWIGPDLFYDAGSSDPDTIAASNAAADGFTFYPGSDSQSPDPRMQAALGVDSTPAYRGLAYIVFYDLPLEKYGNSLVGAQVKAELMNASAPVSWTATQETLAAPAKWEAMAASPSSVIAVARGATNQVARTHDGQTWSQVLTTTSEDRYCSAWGDGIFLTMNSGYGFDKSTDDGATWVHVVSDVSRDWAAYPTNTYPPYSASSYAGMAYGAGRFVAVSGAYCAVTADGGVTWQRGVMPASRSWAAVAHNGAVFCAVAGGTNYCATSADGVSWVEYSMAGAGDWHDIASGGGLFVAVGWGGALQSSPTGAAWSAPSAPGYNYDGIAWSGEYFVAVSYTSSMAAASLDGVTWAPISMPTSADWNACVAFQGAVLAVAYDTSIAAYISAARRGAGQVLSEIVSSECIQSGLLDHTDVDVSALTQTVRGYRIGSAGSIRSALDPLRSSWPFDVVQRGYKVVFVSRGGASIGTIPAADLDARADGATPGVQITTSREMDSQMPVRVTINHLDVDREYDTGTQYAERLNTSAINVLTHDLPIVLTATEAAGKAEVLLYLAWLERHDVLISLPPTWAHLEPGDVVGLTTPEGVVSLRITAANYTADGRVECSAKYANAAIYTPTAVGESGQSTGESEIAWVGQSSCELLDIPLVHDAQSGIGFPVAMYGTSEGWRGGVLYQSRDAGATWLTAEEFGPPGATVGRATNTIGAVESRMLDRASVLTVVLSSGELYDVTELSMLAGANHFAYGGPGRWEIVAAQNCTLQSGTTYALSNMARGLAGTEWAMALHAVDDALVLLDSSDLQMLALSGADIGAPRLYRAISIGRDFGTDGDRSMTYSAVNLKPLSPVYLKGSRHPSTGDWAVEWTRRTRVGGEWRDYVDADIGEPSQLFEIEVYDGPTYSVVKRTISSETPNANYTSSQQFADFGSIQEHVYVKVFQISTSVGRGYPLAGVLVIGATGHYFVQTDDITYFELLPAALQTLNETFVADTGFTKYSEGTPGTTSVAGNNYIVTHVGGRNDIITKNTVSFNMPQAWIEATINVTSTGATGYDNGGVGLVKDADNFIFASMDRLANIARIQIKIAGSNVFVGSLTLSFGTSFKLGLSLVATSACMWADTGAGWTYIVGADVAGYYDFRNSGNLTSWKPGFTLANGGGNSTWEFSAFKAGCFGGVGMRDQTLVTNDDATPYLATATAIQFTATSVDPRGVGYCGIYTLDMTSKVLAQTAALMVSRGGKVYNDLACHVIKYASGNRRVLISTWGNGFGASLQILHGLLTSGDVLTGTNVVTLTQLSLPGQVGVSPGCYDPMLAWDASNSRWLIAYTLVDDTSFAGNPFYAALAHSSDLSSFTLIAKDSANAGYEGTKIVSDDGALLITAGGPAGIGDRARVYDATLSYMSVLDLVLSGGVDTQPHAAMFTYAGNRYVLSFDNTRYGSAPFTWGRLRLYMDTV